MLHRRWDRSVSPGCRVPGSVAQQLAGLPADRHRSGWWSNIQGSFSVEVELENTDGRIERRTRRG
jgi:hypothetical protein